MFASLLEGVAQGLERGIAEKKQTQRENIETQKDQTSYYNTLRQAGYSSEEAASKINEVYGGTGEEKGFLGRALGGKKTKVFNPPKLDAYAASQQTSLIDPNTGQVVGQVPKNSKFLQQTTPVYDAKGKFLYNVPKGSKVLANKGASLGDILDGDEDSQPAAPSGGDTNDPIVATGTAPGGGRVGRTRSGKIVSL